MPLFSGILGPFNTILYDKIWCKNTNPRHFTLISSEPRVGGSNPFRRTKTKYNAQKLANCLFDDCNYRRI